MNLSIGTKSIASLRPCIIVLLVFFIATSTTGIRVNEHKKIIADLPKVNDFYTFLSVLEFIVDFCSKHEFYVDVNMEFGLFLISANLRAILQEKRQNLSATDLYRIKHLFLKTDIIADYFHEMIQNTTDTTKGRTEPDRIISRLFYNASTWPRPFHKFNTDLLKHTKIYTREHLVKIYGQWEYYSNLVYQSTLKNPSRMSFDECAAVLAEKTRIYDQRAPGLCFTHPNCKLALMNGNDFGYSLTHKVLFMVAARFSRVCIVFSEEEDKQQVEDFCVKSFIEMQYIAFNDFRLPDLMMEHMLVCGLFGHAQFYRSSWLYKLIEYQSTKGCFSFNTLSDLDSPATRSAEVRESDKWQISRSTVMQGECNVHITAVASGVFAAAVRYVMEKYY